MSAENQVLSLIARIGGNSWFFAENEGNSCLMKFVPIKEAMSAKIIEMRHNDGKEFWTLKDEISDEIYNLTDDIFKDEGFSIIIGDISKDVSGFEGKKGEMMIITLSPVSAEEALAFQRKFHDYGANVVGVEKGPEI